MTGRRDRFLYVLLVLVLTGGPPATGCFGKKTEKPGGAPGRAADRPKITSEGTARASRPAPALVPAVPLAAPAEPSDHPFVPLSEISADPEIRRQIAALADAGAAKHVMDVLFRDKPAAIPALRRALRHRQRNVRVQAAQILARGEMVSPETTAAFVAALRQDPDQEVRASVAKELRHYIDPALVGPLRETLSSDTYGMARANAAWALSAQGRRSAVPALIDALKDGETWVRLRSLNALRTLGARRALPAIVELLRDPNEMVRDRALKTLRKISGKHYGADYGRWQRAVGR